MVELVSRRWIVFMKFHLVCDMFTLGVYRSPVGKSTLSYIYKCMYPRHTVNMILT
jgi:hypothetical protein